MWQMTRDALAVIHRMVHPQRAAAVVHYYRTPKTGSSALLERIVGVARRIPCVLGPLCNPDVHTLELECTAQSSSSTAVSLLRFVVHDHSNGCHHGVCNASANAAHDDSSAGAAARFTVLREPCERMQSVLDQVAILPRAPSEMGARFRTNESDAFLAYLRALIAGCAPHDASCAVRAIDARVRGDSRVFLYPQVACAPFRMRVLVHAYPRLRVLAPARPCACASLCMFLLVYCSSPARPPPRAGALCADAAADDLAEEQRQRQRQRQH